MNTWQRVSLTLILVVLLATAYNGIVEGLNAARIATTSGQHLASTTQLAYGALSVGSLLTMALRLRATRVLLVGWGIALVSTAVAAPVVYAGASALVGIATGLVAATVAASIIEGWRRINVQRSKPILPAA